MHKIVNTIIKRQLWHNFQNTSTEIKTKMRYFPNKIPDHSENTPIHIQEETIQEFITSIVDTIEDKFKPTTKNGEDGVYLGTAGIAYMYYHLSQNPKFEKDKPKFLNSALEYLKPALKVTQAKSKDAVGFILGGSGVFAVSAAIYNDLGDRASRDHYKKLFFELADISKSPKFLSCGSDELFVGRAGYVLGTLWLAKELKMPLDREELYKICKVMVDTGKEYSIKTKSKSPLMYSYYKTEYLGAAHGLCTILQAIISVPGYLDSNPHDAKLVKDSVNYLLDLQDFEGNFPCTTDEIEGPNELVHWCHGAGGMIFLMAKAYLTWQDHPYLAACETMADLIWEKGLLKKGPGICHGVAGNGYAFLLMYRLTAHKKYYYRALAFADFMRSETFINEARTPDCPFSLYEGTAGTACFLGDLLHPNEAKFPFSDVF